MSEQVQERPYVVALETNIKSGAQVQLGRKTLLVGRNGTGKSTVVAGVELALSGRVSDIAGRESVAKTLTLFKLHTEGKGELSARVLLSDNTQCSWSSMSKTGKSASKAKHETPAAVQLASVFPLRAVRNAITGEPDTVRRFFLQFAAEGLSTEDITKQIPADLQKKFAQAAGGKLESDPIAALLGVVELCKEKAREARTAAKLLDEVAEKRAGDLPAEPTEEQLKTAKKAVEVARHILEVAVGHQLAQDHAAQHQANMAQMGEVSQQAEQLYAQLQQLEASDEGQMWPMFEACKLLLKHAVEQRQAVCPCCAGVPGLDVLTNRLNELLVAGRTVEAHGQHLNAVREQHKGVIHELERLTAATQAVPIGVAEGEQPQVQPVSRDQAAADLDTVEAKLRELESAATQWAELRKNEAEGKAKADNAEEWKKLEEACSKTVKRLLDSSVLSFTKRVQAHLPAADVFKIELDKKGNCRFGFERNGVLHEALSGAEWARQTAALAAVCTPDDEGVHVIIPEDRAFDHETLADALDALSSVPAQVILHSPVWPMREGSVHVPEDWTVICTDERQHKQANGHAGLSAASAAE